MKRQNDATPANEYRGLPEDSYSRTRRSRRFGPCFQISSRPLSTAPLQRCEDLSLGDAHLGSLLRPACTDALAAESENTGIASPCPSPQWQSCSFTQTVKHCRIRCRACFGHCLSKRKSASVSHTKSCALIARRTMAHVRHNMSDRTDNPQNSPASEPEQDFFPLQCNRYSHSGRIERWEAHVESDPS